MANCGSKIQIKRGLKADFASVTLLPGELALVTDTGELYIGDASGKNVLINPTYGTAADLNVGTAAGEIPVINTGGKLDPSILPSLAISEVYLVDSQKDMLDLIADVGDVAVRTDTNETFMLSSEPASNIDNWVKISSDLITSVNGATGAVVLTGSDIFLPLYTMASSCKKITSEDSITQALGKLEYRIDNIDGGSFV